MTEYNIFQEVQEDLERQKFEALWKRYGFWVLVAALGVVVATASSTAYRSWKVDHEQKQTAALIAASEPGPDTAKIIDRLQAFTDGNAGTSYAGLALLRAGALAADHSDKAQAVTFFDRAAADTHLDTALRQLGDLLSVQAQMDSGDAAALSARLQPLTEDGAAWRYSAMEDQGYLALRAGDKAKAKQIFTALSEDSRVPQTIGARASDILRSLN